MIKTAYKKLSFWRANLLWKRYMGAPFGLEIFIFFPRKPFLIIRNFAGNISNIFLRCFHQTQIWSGTQIWILPQMLLSVMNSLSHLILTNEDIIWIIESIKLYRGNE